MIRFNKRSDCYNILKNVFEGQKGFQFENLDSTRTLKPYQCVFVASENIEKLTLNISLIIAIFKNAAKLDLSKINDKDAKSAILLARKAHIRICGETESGNKRDVTKNLLSGLAVFGINGPYKNYKYNQAIQGIDKNKTSLEKLIILLDDSTNRGKGLTSFNYFLALRLFPTFPIKVTSDLEAEAFVVAVRNQLAQFMQTKQQIQQDDPITEHQLGLGSS